MHLPDQFLLLLCLACGACEHTHQGDDPTDGATSAPAASDAPLAVAAGQHLVYELAWSWDGASWDEDAAAYVFETDLGYTVGIEAGYIGSARVELIPCMASAGVLPVLADHAYDSDSSLVVAPVVEPMLAADARPFGTGASSGSAYCGLHVLSAPLDQTADDGFHLQSRSIHVRGWYQAPGDSTPHALDAAVGLATGALVALAPAEPARATEPILANDGTPAAARVILERFPARALDGVVFEELTPAELAYEMLAGLGRTAVASYQLDAP